MKKLFSAALALALAMSLAACGGQGGGTADDTQDAQGVKLSGLEGRYADSTLPEWGDFITREPSETEPNAELAKALIAEFAIPSEYVGKTYYFYNYVDLNGDGSDEIIAEVVGDYVSGIEGNCGAIIVANDDGSLTVNRVLNLVTAPLIVTDTYDIGWLQIIAPYNAGADAESIYKLLRINNEGKKYFNIPDAEDYYETLEGITGTAVLFNDVNAEIEAGTALTLG